MRYRDAGYRTSILFSRGNNFSATVQLPARVNARVTRRARVFSPMSIVAMCFEKFRWKQDRTGRGRTQAHQRLRKSNSAKLHTNKFVLRKETLAKLGSTQIL